MRPDINISPANAVAPNITKMISRSQDNAMFKFDSKRIPRPIPDNADSIAATVRKVTASASESRLGLSSLISQDHSVI